MLQASQSARIKRNDENKTGVHCGWSPWILIAVQLLSQLYFWPVYSGPTQNTHATERDLNIPKVARPNFCCQYIHIEALAFPHHYQKSFSCAAKCNIFGKGVVSTLSQNLHKRGGAKGTSIKSVGTYPIIIVHLWSFIVWSITIGYDSFCDDFLSFLRACFL